MILTKTDIYVMINNATNFMIYDLMYMYDIIEPLVRAPVHMRP